MLLCVVAVVTSVEAAPREKRQILGAILGGLLGGGHGMSVPFVDSFLKLEFIL